jgi:hypothetical protein
MTAGFETLMESDEIHFVIGTRINIAHQDPNLPLRRRKHQPVPVTQTFGEHARAVITILQVEVI